ncbi:nuclear cap binding protein [Aureococcus anophagefferens]|uniref:Nuclear cap binding protein n=1 Tax=Aureococcus anophagefferens TaxID=44056 RepID=A0ABR1FXJ0_AURAN
MGYQDDDGHYNRGSNRDYGGHRDYDRRGGGGGGYRNDRRRRSGGGGGGYRNDHRNDRGGGYRNTKRRRTDYGGGGGGPKLNAAPAVDMGAASSKLVQLLVRVADARARKTTDAEIPLADNLDALAGAIADKELDDGRRVAGQLVLVARESRPSGARARRALAALLAAKREGWATMVADAAGEAFMAALTGAGVVETDGDRGLESLLRRLADAFDEPPASSAARDRADLCAGLVAAAAAAGAGRRPSPSRQRHRRGRRARGVRQRLRALDAPATSAPVDSLEALVFGLRDCAACRFDAVDVAAFDAPSPLPRSRRVHARRRRARPRAAREFFAHFLSNTKFAWPYWSYWAAVADEDGCDAQRRFVACLLEHCVRLDDADRA